MDDRRRKSTIFTTITAIALLGLAGVGPVPAAMAERDQAEVLARAEAAAPRPGQCFKLTTRQKSLGTFPDKPKPVDCASAHDYELVKAYRVPKKLAKYGPASMAVVSWTDTACTVRHVPRYLGRIVPTLDFRPILLLPSPKQWRKGSRTVFCGGASYDSRLRHQRSSGAVEDLADLRDNCFKPGNGISECIPGTVRVQRHVQVYPNAWTMAYPGKSELLKAIVTKVEQYVPAGSEYYHAPPATKKEWNRGDGRYAFLGLPV